MLQSSVLSHQGSQGQQTNQLFGRDIFLLCEKPGLTETYEVFDEHGTSIMGAKREGGHLGQLASILLTFVLVVVFVALTFRYLPSLSEPWDTIMMVFGFLFAVLMAIIVGGAIRPRRHIDMFMNDQAKTPLLTIHQDQRLAYLKATFTVIDADRNVIGRFQRRRTFYVIPGFWIVTDAQGQQLCQVREQTSTFNSVLLLLLALSIVFIVIVVIVMYLIRRQTDYRILMPDGHTSAGYFRRRELILKKFSLNLSPDELRTIDRRLAVALGVLVDTIEKR